MPEHTIAENLSRLITAKTDIANAITTMGGVVGENDGFEDFPADILRIPTSSGGTAFPLNVGSYSNHGYGFYDGSVLILCGYGYYLNQQTIYFPKALSNYGFDPPSSVTGAFYGGDSSSGASQYSLSGSSTSLNVYLSGSNNYRAFYGYWIWSK